MISVHSIRQAEDVLDRLQDVDNKIGYRLSREELDLLNRVQGILVNLQFRDPRQPSPRERNRDEGGIPSGARSIARTKNPCGHYGYRIVDGRTTCAHCRLEIEL